MVCDGATIKNIHIFGIDDNKLKPKKVLYSANIAL